MPLTPGDTLQKGQYRILRLLGQGGFAFVYQARDTLLGRDVAIKELVPSAVTDATWVKRFLIEARTTLDLHHDHVVATHTLFAESGNHYLVMEYMPGGSLEDLLLKTVPLPVDDVLRIARQVCEGLAYAHRRGIVHCDLKPGNILFAADGTAKVADFGLAHVPSHGARSRHWATSGLFVAGTLEYMPPEQAQGKRSDPRLDLYALGALLYHMLAGHPYADFDDSGTPAAIGHNLDLIQNHQPAPPSTHNSRVPPWLDDVVLRLLAKRPEDRPATAAEVLDLLLPSLPAAQRPAIQPPPPAGPSPTAGPSHRTRWVRYGLFALLVVILVVALWLWLGPTLTPVPTAVPATDTAMPSPSATLSPSDTPTSPLAPTPAPWPTRTAAPTPTPTRTPTPTPTPTPEPSPTPLPKGGRIAFASGAGGSLQIYVMYADGSGQTRLTDNGFLNESPAWSPDGKRLAFHSRKDGNFEIYVMNADGTGLTNVTNNPFDDGSPSWSPDGRLIAFDTGRDGNSEIYVMNADGSEPTNLTNNPSRDSLPAWSPNGQRIAFVSSRDGNAEIYVMDANGSNLTRLTDNTASDESPAWSPDGKLIAFFSNPDDGMTTEIYVMNADGSGVRRLTRNSANDGSPSWSPDGKRIAFDSDRDGNWEIYVMNVDGSDQANLTKSPVDDHFPASGPE